MTEERKLLLLEKLERGGSKAIAYFRTLPPSVWQLTIHRGEGWRVRDLLAHFVSAEIHLLTLALTMMAGKPGAPDGLNIDEFNQQEQARLAEIPVEDLLDQLAAARRETITWLQSLPADQLAREVRHPVLGEISLETFVESIYGHQLLHMRELRQVLEDTPSAAS